MTIILMRKHQKLSGEIFLLCTLAFSASGCSETAQVAEKPADIFPASAPVVDQPTPDAVVTTPQESSGAPAVTKGGNEQVVVQEPAKPTAESFAKLIPTTAFQARAVLDLSTLPMIEPTEHWTEKEMAFHFGKDFTTLYYQSSEAMSDLAIFYRQHLKSLEWVELANPYADKYRDKMVIATFTKQGQLLGLMLQQASPEESSVNFTLQGNIDSQRIPLPTDAQTVAATTTMTVSKTSLTPQEIIKFYDSLLGDQGWLRHREYDEEDYTPETHGLNYLRNAVRIKIRPASESLQVSASLLLLDYPIMGDAEAMLCQRESCSYDTSASPQEVAAFTEKKLESLGWVHKPEMQEVSETFAQLFFQRSDGKGLLINGLKRGKGSRVEIGIVEPDKLQELAVHRALLKKVPSTYLVMDNPKMLTLNSYYNELNYRVSTTVAEAADYYLKTLRPRGWYSIFDPEINESEASFSLKHAEHESLRVKIVPFGADQVAITVGGQLQPLIDASE